MKRYLVFAGHKYDDDELDITRGWLDFKIDGDTIEECIDLIVRHGQCLLSSSQESIPPYKNRYRYMWKFGWLHVVDTTTGTICLTDSSISDDKLFHKTNPGEELIEENIWDKNLKQSKEIVLYGNV